MNRNALQFSGLFFLFLLCTFLAGCTTTSDQADQTAQPAGTAATGPLYSTGDIVKNPRATTNTAWLIIGYDSSTGMYERALVYPNADGSWGYRTDNRTDTAERAVMEKVYTVKLETIAPSAVPIVTPTVVTTAVTAGTTRSATVSSTTSVKTRAATVSATAKPSIRKIIPDEGYAGTTVAITDLSGDSFLSGANVSLTRSGSADILATNVVVSRASSLTCSFSIPSDAPAGTWNVVVTNPNGQSATFTNLFSVHRDASMIVSATQTLTGTIPITSIDPPSAFSGYQSYIIKGSKFQKDATVKLTSENKADIVASLVEWHSSTELLCFFNIPIGSAGTWDIVVTNPDDTTGTWHDAFTVR